MSIQQIQTEMILSALVRNYYSDGIDPTMTQLQNELSRFFAKYPGGLPLPLDTTGIVSRQTSDVQALNILLAHLKFNVQVLYQTCQEQIAELLMLNSLLTTDIDLLTAKQNRVKTKIDDFLLSLYNTSGYFFTLSDNFADLSLSDMSLTTAFIDTAANKVTIPTISNLTQIVAANNIAAPNIFVVQDGVTVNYNTISPFTFAINGATNTLWEMQVTSITPAQQVVVTVDIPFNQSAEICKSVFDPYGIAPVQAYMQRGVRDSTTNTYAYSSFGSNIYTTSTAVNFIDTSASTDAMRLVLRKTAYDIKDTSGATVKYIYIFGARDISFLQEVFDNNCTFVSGPLTLEAELQQDMVIDAVSLTTQDNRPPHTNLKYYVATDPYYGGQQTSQSLGDFNWIPIAPLNANNPNVNTVVNFNGSILNETYITQSPQNANDLQLLPINTTSTDITKLNPNPNIIPATDVYVLANFTDSFLPNSITLTEGINSTKIYSLLYSPTIVNDLTTWNNAITSQNATINYGRVDTGNGFFYGGDVGANGMSIYVETYLYIQDPIAPVVDVLSKADPNAQTWSVNAYLNGSQVASMPGRNTDNHIAAVDNQQIPWNFQQGNNHIALTINIPPAASTQGIQNPYLGVLQLMQNTNFYVLGTVKLADWSYVSFFDLEYNQPGTPSSFTVYNKQLITKKQPTTNYRLVYNQASGLGPQAIRFRADMARDFNDPNVTPELDQYRLQFNYVSRV